MAPSAYRDAFTGTENDRPSTSGSTNEKKELWSSLLDNVSSGKKVPEKNLIILGGTSDTQKEFLDSLQQNQPSRLRPPDRSRPKKIPLANRFALGYTYQDVYDSDHEGMSTNILHCTALSDIKHDLTSHQTLLRASRHTRSAVPLPHMHLYWPASSLPRQSQTQPQSFSLIGQSHGLLCALFAPGYDS